jgi:hypothetical protein
MSDNHDSDHVSVGEWMLLMLVPAVPIIGWILVLVLAFSGRNQTRKNYFRACIAWVLLLIVGIILAGLVLGANPSLFQSIKDWQAEHH